MYATVLLTPLAILCMYVDFKNPDDPEDKSFEAHSTDYPVVDLEFPNTGACER